MSNIELGNLIVQDRIRIRQSAASKKKALELLSEILFNDLSKHVECDAFTHKNLLDAFIAREKIGSTALEHGIAIPHCRIDVCTKPMIALITLSQAIDFGSTHTDVDVDIICGLIVPPEECEEHLDILAALVKVLGVEKKRAAIREADSVETVYQTFRGPSDLIGAGT